MQDGSKTLAGVDIFNGLEQVERRELEAKCRWMHFDTKGEIINQYDQADELYFLISGEVTVMLYSAKGKVVDLRTMQAGSFFGDLSVLDGEPRSAGVEATQPTLVGVMPGRVFRELLDKNVYVMRSYLRHMTHMVRNLTARVYERHIYPVPVRVQVEFLRRSVRVDEKQAVVDPLPTLETIANRIGTHREAVSREITRLTEMGLVLRDPQSRLTILDVPGLLALLNEETGEEPGEEGIDDQF